METQKRYHDLVLLDDNNESKQIVTKKLFFIFLLFLVGVVIGALLISLLHNKNKLTAQAVSTTGSIGNITGELQEIAPPELQSITTITTPSSKKDGCSIESLGRNLVEGCSVDDYAEMPAELDNTAVGMTKLDILSAPENTANNVDIPSVGGVTNILDLQ